MTINNGIYYNVNIFLKVSVIPEPSISSRSYSHQRTEFIESKISISNGEHMSSLDDPERIKDHSKDKKIEQIPISITVHAAENDDNVDKHISDKIVDQDTQNKSTKDCDQVIGENEVKSPAKVHNLAYTGIYHSFNTKSGRSYNTVDK